MQENTNVATEKVRDETMPEGKWKFDADVTAAFDDMLARSIPQYADMRYLCFAIGSKFVRPGTDIVDLGCSNGLALESFVNKFGAHNRYTGVEVSPDMLKAAKMKYSGMIDCHLMNLSDHDLRRDYPPVRASLTLAVLTIQFIPPEYRQQIMHRIYEHTLPGGALIMVEKVTGMSGITDAVMTDTYYKLKAANGYSQEQIDRKRLSLEGVLMSGNASYNEELMANNGFRHVECFWRWCNFAGWLAVREA